MAARRPRDDSCSPLWTSSSSAASSRRPVVSNADNGEPVLVRCLQGGLRTLVVRDISAAGVVVVMDEQAEALRVPA